MRWIGWTIYFVLVSPYLIADDVPKAEWRVKHFNSPEARVLTLTAGKASGLDSGMLLRAYRLVTDDDDPSQVVPVETGMLRVQSVGLGAALAEVVDEGTNLSRAVFPDHPGVMADDRVVRPQYLLHRNQELTPQVDVPYASLFEDPKRNPQNFELTEQGEERIRKEAAIFADKRVGLMLVTGYTDAVGPSAQNQVESYQRALAVRHFLVQVLGFDESRVVAMGMGEDGLRDSSNVAGSQTNNRRISLKVVASP